MGLPPPPLSPRPGGQGRRQRLMPRRASVEDGPDSQPDPQSPGRARTLKRSSRRHGPSARRPPAPLLSGLLSAHAQRRRPPRLRSQQACASLRAGSAGTPAQAQTGTARRPPPLPHSLKSFKAAPLNNNLPPSGDTSVTEGLLPQGALTLLTLSLYCVTASSECPKCLDPSGQPPRNRHNLSCAVTAPFGASASSLGHSTRARWDQMGASGS